MKNTRRGGWIVFLVIWNFLLSYGKLIRVCSGLENKTQWRVTLKVERKIETEIFILVPLTNREYVQSSCTTKRVHYNHKRLQMLKHTCKRLPMLKYTNKRLPNAQARRQETSIHKFRKNRVWTIDMKINVQLQNKYNFWYKT